MRLIKGTLVALAVCGAAAFSAVVYGVHNAAKQVEGKE